MEKSEPMITHPRPPRPPPPPPPPPPHANSKPVLFVDIAYNLVFAILSSGVLLTTKKERPSTPLRIWVYGYACQCLVRLVSVCFECNFRRRRRRRRGQQIEQGRESGAVKKWESLEMLSFLWWLLGFYWIAIGGQALIQDAPRLYWLTVMFLAFDVVFAIFCIILACLIGIALSCCFPCIVAFIYAVAGQEGASDDDVSMLPTFRFHPTTGPEEFDLEKEQAVAVTIPEADYMDELALLPEDSECCICLSQYEDGAELLSLPCNHHFHSGCIIKWLRTNATCPLCKYNILNDNNDDDDDHDDGDLV